MSTPRAPESERVTDGEVCLTVENKIATVVLSRIGSHNALTLRMITQLAEIVETIERDDDIDVVVITGAGGKAFSAGGDLKDLIPRLTAGELDILFPDSSQRFFSDLYRPIIAAVNGICIGGGLEILLGTDIRIAADHSIFGLPEVRWGLIPGGGSHVRLPQQLSWPAAMRLLLTAESINATEALRIGLVNEVRPAAEVLPRAYELAAMIARNAPVAVRTAKEIAVRALDNEPRFRLETLLNRRVLATRDAREGPAAFAERRPPRFHGR